MKRTKCGIGPVSWGIEGASDLGRHTAIFFAAGRIRGARRLSQPGASSGGEPPRGARLGRLNVEPPSSKDPLPPLAPLTFERAEARRGPRRELGARSRCGTRPVAR